MNITLSLSRALKLKERMLREIGNLNTNRSMSVCAVLVPMPEETGRVALRREEYLRCTKLLGVLRKDVLSLGVLIAEANAQAGIPQLLVEHALTNKELADLSQVLSCASTQAGIDVANVERYLTQITDGRGVKVNVLASDELREMEIQIAELRSRQDRLLDQINDKNVAHKVSVVVNDELAGLLGLS